ncbi:MAG: DUF429 domain-containing protein [Candidatus Altiarchaeota archaeon]|nr:DUF429 domain-containing protein [Candidatus Altiarchaeota archaeon]
MKVVGLDLAGNPKNDTGFCIMEVADDRKHVSTSIVHSDPEIIEKLKEIKPELVAIDAPLTYSGTNRRCDDELREYGALPVTLRGMETLAKRGSMLAEKLRDNGMEFIEVFSTATAKILGFYDRREMMMQKNLIASGIKGSVDERILSKDELDAIFAAITACLHLSEKTVAVGEGDNRIITPQV